MRGILDRFEGDKAVILIEEKKDELILPKSDLPVGSKVNTVFNVKEKNDGGYTVLSIDSSGTDSAAAKSSSLMDKLRAKSSGSKFRK